MSQWADQNRRLSPEASSEPGRWVTDRAPYQRGMMDAVNEPGVSEVVFMTSSQIGKTEILNNIIGYFTHQDPSPLLMIQPTLDMAETWSKDRLAPMIRDTEVLTSLFKDPKSRDSDNTLLHKKFAGGHITMAGANSPASLASRPIRIVLLDEEDRYPSSAGAEGDPGSLAQKRTTTFWNRLLITASTPTNEGESKIASRYEQSDQRKFYVPCPECGATQVMNWAQIKFEKRQSETTYYECEHCQERLGEGEKPWMLAHGEWTAEAAFNGIAGFHISELYSPWVRWEEMVENFLKAKRLPETLKVWVNTSLGETWKDKTEGVDPSGLLKRKENWGRVAPEGVVAVTVGADIQADRIECEVIGWGVGQESWSLQYHVLHGDPTNRQDKVWDDLDEVRYQQITRADGAILNIGVTAIDSGFATQTVYEYCKQHEADRVFPIKGASTIGKPLVSKYSKSNKLRVKLFTIGTDTAKQMIYSRLKIHQPGPGYCHFPADYPEEYFKQLTAERIQTKFINGHPTRVWVMPKSRRNEALDCRVYGLAALHILNPNLNRLAQDQERERLKQREGKKQEAQKSGGWMGYEDWNFN